jgi:hypothetical protein
MKSIVDDVRKGYARAVRVLLALFKYLCSTVEHLLVALDAGIVKRKLHGVSL